MQKYYPAQIGAKPCTRGVQGLAPKDLQGLAPFEVEGNGGLVELVDEKKSKNQSTTSKVSHSAIHR